MIMIMIMNDNDYYDDTMMVETMVVYQVALMVDLMMTNDNDNDGNDNYNDRDENNNGVVMIMMILEG